MVKHPKSQKDKGAGRRWIRTALMAALIALLVLLVWPAFVGADFMPSGDLEIHYINVGQGTAVLIIGPNGTRIMYDFGWLTGEENVIVPYLEKSVGLKPQDGLHYTIVSHRDSDHYMGYRDVIKAGYKILVANYEADSPKQKTARIRERWFKPAAKESGAGAVQSIPVGLTISLGNGAEAVVVAANGQIIGHEEPIRISNENDRSVVLFIHYGKFQFILDGDLGAGPEVCTRHKTSQKNLQEVVAEALIDEGLMDEETGVDVMHVAHHGSESSTSAAYYNLVQPQVGIISVGPNQGNFRHPRKFVVESVLFGSDRPQCAMAPVVDLLLQTDDGIEEEEKCDHCGLNIGLSVGDIFIRTDGVLDYEIQVSNCLFEGTPRAVAPGQGWRCRFDEDEPFGSGSSRSYCEEVVFDQGERMATRCSK